MKAGIEIRPVQVDDLRDIYLMGRERFAVDTFPAWNEENLADVMAQDPGLSRVAISKKKPAGFVIASPGKDRSSDTAVIRWICARETAPAGLLGDLLASFSSAAAERKMKKIVIILQERNSELIEYFRNFGFTESNRLIIMENFLH